MEYSNIKRNMILIDATTWIYPETVMPIEKWHKWPYIILFNLHGMSRIDNSTRKIVEAVVGVTNGYWVQGFFEGWWNVLKLDGGDGCTTLWLH